MIQITPFTCITCVNLFLTYDASKNDTRDDSIPSEYIILYCSPIPWRLISTILTHLGFKVVSFRTAVFIKRCTFWQSAIGEYLHFLKFQGGFDAPNIYNTYIINTYNITTMYLKLQSKLIFTLFSNRQGAFCFDHIDWLYDDILQIRTYELRIHS